MAGFDAPYVPGWDCHGLPIEIKVDEQLGGRKLEMDPVEVRQACREYAQKFIDLQRSQFKRLGVLGRWDNPYATMNFAYEASILETFYGFYEKGFVYKGLKPVYWCSHDRTALAEAEVEYEMHTSPSVYVRYALTSKLRKRLIARLAGKKMCTRSSGRRRRGRCRRRWLSHSTLELSTSRWKMLPAMCIVVAARSRRAGESRLHATLAT